MRRALLPLAGAATVLTAAPLAPAAAMTVGTAPGVKAALAQTSIVDEVVYVCRHRYLTSRRLCWWRPGGYSWKFWRRRH